MIVSILMCGFILVCVLIDALFRLHKKKISHAHPLPEDTWSSEEIVKNTFLSDEHIQDLYQLLKDTTELLDLAHIPYIVTCGAALGIQRHGGLIPWDDDIDLVIFEQDEEKLCRLQYFFEKLGYEFNYNGRMYQLSKQKNPITSPSFKQSIPFLEIALIHEHKNRFIYSNDRLKHAFPNALGEKEIIFPLRQYPCGPINVWSVQNIAAYATTNYGKDWYRTAYIHPHHVWPEHRKKIKLDLLKHPIFKAPALPLKPLKERVAEIPSNLFAPVVS